MVPELRGVAQKGARCHEISRCTVCISMHLKLAQLLQCCSVHSWAILFRPCNILQRFVRLCYQHLSTNSLLKDCGQARLRYSPRRKPRVRTDPGSLSEELEIWVPSTYLNGSEVQEGDFMWVQWWCGHCFFAYWYKYRVLPFSSCASNLCIEDIP